MFNIPNTLLTTYHMNMMASSTADHPNSSCGGGFNHRSKSQRYLPFISSYLLFGLLHELSHISIASALLGSSLLNHPFHTFDGLLQFLTRALLGRYCLIEVVDNGDMPSTSSWAFIAIRHFGWIFSFMLAIGLHHYYHHRCCKTSSLVSPIVILAAYATTLEAVTTDLFNFVPIFGQEVRTLRFIKYIKCYVIAYVFTMNITQQLIPIYTRYQYFQTGNE